MNIDETDGRSSGDGERMGGHISVSMVSPKLLIINSKQSLNSGLEQIKLPTATWSLLRCLRKIVQCTHNSQYYYP